MWQRLCMITGTLAVWMWVALLNLPPYVAIAVSAALVSWYVVYRVRQERHRMRYSTALEQALLPEAAVMAGQAEAKFVAALREIKARGVHQAPLVDLPIYVTLGASQSGVRSLLAHVGLRWRGRELKPVMGCQWWLDDSCIVVRPTGTDLRATRACMDALRRFRRPTPIHGVLITLSLGDLLDLPEAQLKRNGTDLRAALESLQDPLHARAPVYLIITQADRLPGFVATFAKATPQQRQNLWGDTFNIRADEQHAQEALGNMLDTMVQQSAAQSLQHMQMSSDVEAREQIYQFPEHLAALRGPLLTWSNAFFATTHRRANPRLCGAYVCSAAPKESMAFHGSLPGQASQALGAPFFTSSLMSVGMLPGLGRPTAVGAVGEGPWARPATLAAALVLVLLPVVSYVNNSLQFSGIRQTVEGWVDEGKSGSTAHVASLHNMDALADMLTALDKDSAQTTYLNAHMGMNQSAELAQKLRRLYLTSLRDRVLAPLLAADAQRMHAFVAHYKLPAAQVSTSGGKKRPSPSPSPPTVTDDDEEQEEAAKPPAPDEQEYAALFNRLKSHLICTAEMQETYPQDVQNNAWLVTNLARRWGKAAGETTEEARTSESLQRHIAAYVDAARSEPGLRLPRHVQLVADVRAVLIRVPQEVALMGQLTDGVDAYSISLIDLLGAEQAPVHSEQKVRGAYTRAGWENVVRARMAQSGGDAESLWVLGPEGVAQRRAFLEASSADVRDVIYWHNYANAWHALVISLRMAPPANYASRDDADAGTNKTPTQQLAAEYPAAYQRLLQAVKYNLEPAPHQDVQPSASDL